MADSPLRRRRRSAGRPVRGSSGRRPFRWIRRLLGLGLLAVLVAGLAAAGLLYTYAGELPSLDHVSASGLAQSTRIYARDGSTLLDERFEERRTVVPLSAISWDLRHATIAIEDRDFYSHAGVNPLRLLAAAVYDVAHRRAAQGGSTITQQLIKNTLLGSKLGSSRSIDRKAREFLLAMQMERRYSKDQILELYLNTIFYGNRAFGTESAAQTYFAKPARDLDLAEASFLGGLPQRPSFFDPFNPEGFKRARQRQRDVLDAMVRDHYIPAASGDKAYAEDLVPKLKATKEAASGRRSGLAPHFVDFVWEELERRYDAGYLLRGGLRVVTTLDPAAQKLAQDKVREGVQRYAASNRVNNAAMLVMNPHTGEILAMVGSADYFNGDIGGQNNYTVLPRQPGSSFKPYTYVTALMNGWTPASPLDDSHGATAFAGYPVRDWDGREMGTITLRESLQASRNISSVRLFKDVGMQKVFGVARQLGITTKLEPNLSTTLGANEVRMMEHLAAYSAFANGGTRVRPVSVLEIRDAVNQLVEKGDLKPDAGERVLPKEITYVLTDILKGAVRPRIGIPVAAKSGTTNEYKDAWYVGYSTDLAVAAWMGRTVTRPQPANESMNQLWGETGPGAVWHQFMAAYYAGRKPSDWSRPAEVLSLHFCKETGAPTDQTAPELTVADIFFKPARSQACGQATAGDVPGPLPSNVPGLPTPQPVILPSVGPLPSITPPPLPLPSP